MLIVTLKLWAMCGENSDLDEWSKVMRTKKKKETEGVICVFGKYL